jgi:hypothetical protein
MTREFNDWVDVEGLTPAERERLERVHALLVAAGPPPELTAAIEQPPAPVIQFPVWRRRRPLVAALAAAVAVAGAAFGGGYVVGNDNGGMKAAQVMSLRGQPTELASLRIGAPDQVGNSPMILTVTGLPQLEHGYYELFTWRNGKPSYPCGGFRMESGTTSVHLTVPYELKPGTKLVVTVIERGKVEWPGRVVMKSV